MSTTKKILAAVVVCGVFVTSAWARLDGPPPHDWTIPAFGGLLGLQGDGSFTILIVGSSVYPIRLPFYLVVGIIAAALAAFAYLVYSFASKRKSP